jgi:hypothetical protein
MVRLRIDDPMLAPELLAFLRRCECDVEHRGPTTLEVDLRHSLDIEMAMRQLRAGRCYRCAGEIEPFIKRLGSPLCIDCRQSLNGHAAELDEAPIREEWTRMEVEAYVKVWCALHPDCSVELVA